jgi:FKBP-type peptidyl-prolyl cis-trans isomerase
MKIHSLLLLGVIPFVSLACDAPPQLVPTVPPGAEVREVAPADLTAEPSAAMGESITAGKKEAEAKLAGADPNAPPSITLDDAKAKGLIIETVTEGKGDGAAVGKSVSVHYTGKLKDGTTFDTSISRGVPFTFILGRGQVIKGWDGGLQGMKVGEKRKLTIPSDLAYGPQGSGKIPPNATLIFDVEMIAID